MNGLSPEDASEEIMVGAVKSLVPGVDMFGYS